MWAVSPLNSVLNSKFFTFIFAVLLQFADSIKFLSGLNNVVFSDCAIFHKGAKILAIWHYNRILGIFSPRMRRDGYLGTSGQKSDLAIRFGDTDFL